MIKKIILVGQCLLTEHRNTYTRIQSLALTCSVPTIRHSAPLYFPSPSSTDLEVLSTVNVLCVRLSRVINICLAVYYNGSTWMLGTFDLHLTLQDFLVACFIISSVASVSACLTLLKCSFSKSIDCKAFFS